MLELSSLLMLFIKRANLQVHKKQHMYQIINDVTGNIDYHKYSISCFTSGTHIHSWMWVSCPLLPLVLLSGSTPEKLKGKNDQKLIYKNKMMKWSCGKGKDYFVEHNIQYRMYLALIGACYCARVTDDVITYIAILDVNHISYLTFCVSTKDNYVPWYNNKPWWSGAGLSDP